MDSNTTRSGSGEKDAIIMNFSQELQSDIWNSIMSGIKVTSVKKSAKNGKEYIVNQISGGQFEKFSLFHL